MKTTSNDILPEGFKMTELGALPEEWKVVKLGEVADISSGGNAPQGDKYFNGDKPFVRVSHIDNQNYSVNKYDLINDNAINDYRLKLFPKDTIIFPKSGATVYLEKRAMLPIDAYVVSHLCTVISNKEEAIQHFLFYVLISLKLAKEKADGYPTLNISEVKRIPIPLPPLPEQQKIAAALSAVQEAKEKTEAVIAATKALKKSMMKHLFTYGPVPPEETENVPLKETEIGKVPEDWEVVKLGEVVREKITDGTHKTPQYIENGIPFITITNLVNGKIDFSKCRFISEEEHNFLINRCKPEKDDVLLSKVGTLGLTAKICEKDNFSIFVQLALIKPKKEIINSDFLTYMLNSISIQNQIEIKSSQSTMKYIGVEKISQLQIPLPPLPVQQKIASILSAIDAKIEAEENKKKSLEKLFKTLLHNLMTAKIRVNHLEIKV
ncbi:MAG TPA: restriction endonuclease subunit S [Bacteroidales bacterium]|nr:restriction endonuclease subunit S [Bacteroidales bacterium]